MEVENQAPGVDESSTEKMDTSLPAMKSPVKEDESTKTDEVEETQEESSPKKNGSLSGVAEAAAATAAAAASATANASYKREDRVHTSGIIVQFPEMFSHKRDRHILDKFSNSLDVRMQKCAFIECDSEEAAAALQAKLNGSVLNGKHCSASRLDLVERKTIYTSNLKKETTDEYIKATYPGVEEILREKYSVYLKFSSEAESRAAKNKIIKDGINGQKVHCDFDHKTDRFSKPVESPPKKAKVDVAKEETESAVEKKDESKEVEEEEAKEEAADDSIGDVKADEW